MILLRDRNRAERRNSRHARSRQIVPKWPWSFPPSSGAARQRHSKVDARPAVASPAYYCPNRAGRMAAKREGERRIAGVRLYFVSLLSHRSEGTRAHTALR